MPTNPTPPQDTDDVLLRMLNSPPHPHVPPNPKAPKKAKKPRK